MSRVLIIVDVLISEQYKGLEFQKERIEKNRQVLERKGQFYFYETQY
ncbi:hypothetical protein BC781_103679 [Sediminitomix flava]|uniref:Uncharacterized protein n=1 Tax=Sediminitomix flava TaxID=379075 RepID=A0A315ZYI8_SEDFL|nr:hypothetical protein BC781_103679 [Sediminitomix flava]